MKKAFVTIFPLFSEALAYKDVGLIAKYMSAEHGYDSYMVSNRVVSWDGDFFNSVTQVCFGSDYETGEVELDIARYNIIKTLKFIRSLSKKYDKIIVNFYHTHRNTLLLAAVLKTLFSNVYVYIKLDIQSKDAKVIFKDSETFKSKVRNFILDKVDIFSAETIQAFNNLKQKKSIGNRTYLIPNGVSIRDELVYLKSDNFFHEKEKIIFTAGRLESYEKNTRLLIDSYLKSELWKDGWRLILAGSYDDGLYEYIEKKIENIIDNNGETIMLTGYLNREQLFSHMRRAKVFALSSRWEGFALVLPEAVAHGCIIAATDVGGVADVTNMGTLGFIAKEQTVDSFTEALKSAAESEPLLGKKQMDFGITNFDWKSICNKLAKIIDEKTN